jgi:hypothetical protein
LGGRPRRAPVVRLLEPRGRPGPRRAGVAVEAAGAPAAARGAAPPTPARAAAASWRRVYSSISGFSSASRSFISRRFSSRKSVTIVSCSLGCECNPKVELHGLCSFTLHKLRYYTNIYRALASELSPLVGRFKECQRSSSARRRSSVLVASRSGIPPTSARLASAPNGPSGGWNSLR